jgi:hypothetical protein
MTNSGKFTFNLYLLFRCAVHLKALTDFQLCNDTENRRLGVNLGLGSIGQILWNINSLSTCICCLGEQRATNLAQSVYRFSKCRQIFNVAIDLELPISATAEWSAQPKMCYRAQIIPIAPVWGNFFKLRIDYSYFLILDYYLINSWFLKTHSILDSQEFVDF